MKNKASNGIGLPGVLFLIFLILKLTGNIDWSWWWVTSPIWIPLGVVLIISFFIIIFIILLLISGESLEKIKSRFEKTKQQ
jgi:hypothetical protein